MSSSVYLNTLKPGDLIFAGVVINKADTCTYPGSQTSKDINDEKPIRHPCVVLRVGTASVEVAYFATFKEALSLPSHLDVNMWYPVYPAPQQGWLKPLPARRNGKAQWVSLRKRHTITDQWFVKFDETLPISSVNAILSRMRA